MPGIVMIVLFAIALLVAAVWGLVFLRQFGLLGGCLAVLLVGSCLGHPFFHVNVGPLPITLDRVLLGVVVVVYVALRVHGRVERRPLGRVDLVVLMFIGMLAISTVTHDWRANGSQALASLLFFHLMPLAFYLVVREIPWDRRALLMTMGFFVLFGLYLAVTSVFEQQQIWSLVFPRYITSELHAEFLGRGRGPFLNPVGNGMFLCAGLFSLIMFWPHVGRHGRLLIVVLSLVFMAGVYCTLTRVVWLSAVVGIMSIVVLCIPRRWSIPCVVTAAVLAAAVVAAKWEDLNAFKRDRYVSVADMSESASLRPILAYIAWHMYLDHPLTGVGYRQYDAHADYYLSDRTTELRLEQARQFTQHNVVLVLLAETGTIGLGLFVLLMATCAVASWQLWRSCTAGLIYRQVGLLMLLMLFAYAIMAMFHDLTLIPMIHMLVFFLAAILRAHDPQAVQSESANRVLVEQKHAAGQVPAAAL